MIVDTTAHFAPLLWLLIAVLLVLAGAILAGIDPDRTEAVLGNRNVLVASAMAGLLVVGALVLLTAPVVAR